jgi:hypothetical protein
MCISSRIALRNARRDAVAYAFVLCLSCDRGFALSQKDRALRRPAAIGRAEIKKNAQQERWTDGSPLGYSRMD